ncbi:MAG: DUF4173 domain-containing protein [Chloroflexi bacterium]|nr:DUF4173 domain-containing protein [Chloroflexota bacterium]
MEIHDEGVATSATGQNQRPEIRRPWLLLGGALAIGFVCEALLHGQPPGWGYAIAALVAATIWVALGRRLGVQASGAGMTLLALGIFFSVMVAVRASGALVALNVLLGMGIALLLAAVYVRGGLSRLSLADYVVEACLSGLALLIQPFVLIFGDLPKARPAPGGGRKLAPVLWGVLLALPLLLVFGALFAAADAVFSAFINHLFDWLPDLGELVGRLILSLMLAWLALGLARHAFTATGARPQWEKAVNLDFLRVGGTTAITALALVNALFLGFVAVQAVYLFGGADTLIRTGLTHSDYARRGFFELVTVAALVLSLILLADWLVRRVTGRARRVIALLHGLLVVCTLAILASALQRMRLYQQEYGLTELRFYTTAFMAWLGVVLIWLVATVLRSPAVESAGRRRFAFGALVTGLAVAVVLNVVNPDALIARTNLDRAAAGVGQALDARYLGDSLSLDATPTLLAALDRLPEPARADLACRLHNKYRALEAKADRLSWRGNNLGAAAAWRGLAAADAELAIACTGQK